MNYSSTNSELFINTFDKLCKLQKNKLLSKQVNYEANQQIDEVLKKICFKRK